MGLSATLHGGAWLWWPDPQFAFPAKRSASRDLYRLRSIRSGKDPGFPRAFARCDREINCREGRQNGIGQSGALAPNGTGGRDQCAGVSDKMPAWVT